MLLKCQAPNQHHNMSEANIGGLDTLANAASVFIHQAQTNLPPHAQQIQIGNIGEADGRKNDRIGAGNEALVVDVAAKEEIQSPHQFDTVQGFVNHSPGTNSFGGVDHPLVTPSAGCGVINIKCEKGEKLICLVCI